MTPHLTITLEEAAQKALAVLQEFKDSMDFYNKNGATWTHGDGTEVFEASTLMDREKATSAAIESLQSAITLDRGRRAEQEADVILRVEDGDTWNDAYVASLAGKFELHFQRYSELKLWASPPPDSIQHQAETVLRDLGYTFSRNADGKLAWCSPPPAIKELAIKESLGGQELSDEQVDRMLSVIVPGGSHARDWFLPHELPQGLKNVRDVVRLMFATTPTKDVPVDAGGVNAELAEALRKIVVYASATPGCTEAQLGLLLANISNTAEKAVASSGAA